jgi:hypothetical protein
MDPHFLKFWGEFLIQAAEGQRQLEDMTGWMKSGLVSSGTLADLFRQCYGLPPATHDNRDLWRKAHADFYAALKTYAPLWGWVPRDRYERLKKKMARMETRIEDQQRSIERLEALLADSGKGQAAIAARFQTLIDDQQQAFHRMMQAMTASLEAPDHDHD